jgi:hypothetical protein
MYAMNITPETWLSENLYQAHMFAPADGWITVQVGVFPSLAHSLTCFLICSITHSLGTLFSRTLPLSYYSHVHSQCGVHSASCALVVCGTDGPSLRCFLTRTWVLVCVYVHVCV